MQVRLGVKKPPMEAHSVLVVSVQKLLRVQHAPLDWQGALAQRALTMNWLVGGQLAAVVLEQTLVWRLQHAPEGPQLAAAQVVLAYHVPAQPVLTVEEHPASEVQQAPVGRQGLEEQGMLEDQELPMEQLPATTVVQTPEGLQHAPIVLALAHGPEVQEPPK